MRRSRDERNAQVVLRAAGFRVLRLVPNYLDGETGYAMVRENANLYRVGRTAKQLQTADDQSYRCLQDGQMRFGSR